MLNAVSGGYTLHDFPAGIRYLISAVEIGENVLGKSRNETTRGAKVMLKRTALILLTTK